jgi:serine/threonine protein kinase
MCDPGTWAKREKYLGRGVFSTTEKICLPKKNCKKYLVIKTTTTTTKSDKNQIENEIKILNYISKNIGNRYFVKMLDHYTCSCPILPNKKIVVQVLEYLPHDLLSIIYNSDDGNHEKKPWSWWKKVIIQFLEAFALLDKHKIIHNDIAEYNTMVYGNIEKDPKIKLIDFGVSYSDNPKLKLNENVGREKSSGNLQSFYRTFNWSRANFPDEMNKFLDFINDNQFKMTSQDILDEIKKIK